MLSSILPYFFQLLNLNLYSVNDLGYSPNRVRFIMNMFIYTQAK